MSANNQTKCGIRVIKSARQNERELKLFCLEMRAEFAESEKNLEAKVLAEADVKYILPRAAGVSTAEQLL